MKNIIKCEEYLRKFAACGQYRILVKVYNTTNRTNFKWRECDNIQLYASKQLIIEYNPILNCLDITGLSDAEFNILKKHYLCYFNMLDIKKLKAEFYARL